jgi:hypothetical protein
VNPKIVFVGFFFVFIGWRHALQVFHVSPRKDYLTQMLHCQASCGNFLFMAKEDIKTSSSIRLSEDDRKRIKWLRKHFGGVGQSAVVTMAIKRLYAQEKAPSSPAGQVIEVSPEFMEKYRTRNNTVPGSENAK